MMDEPERHRRLWGNVLLTGIKDALWPKIRKESSGSGGTTALEQHQARRWVGSRDFAMVCHLAGMAPDFMAESIRPLIGAPAAEREAFLARLFGDHSPERKVRLAKAREAYGRAA